MLRFTFYILPSLVGSGDLPGHAAPNLMSLHHSRVGRVYLRAVVTSRTCRVIQHSRIRGYHTVHYALLAIYLRLLHGQPLQLPTECYAT